MLESLIIYIQNIIVTYGAWGVFVATIIEEFVAPIPSPLIPLSAGFFLLPDDYTFSLAVVASLTQIALPVSIGVSLGSSVVYAFGYFGGKPAIDYIGRWIGLHWESVERTQARMRQGRTDEVVLFILRLLPIVPGVGISGFCGLIRYPYPTFLVITGIGSFLRAFCLGLVGWQVGEVYATYATAISRFEKYIFLSLLLLGMITVVIYSVRRFRSHQKSREPAVQDHEQ